MVRLIIALAAAAAVGAAGALVLGEYPFEGITVVAAGIVLGLFVGEAALAVNRPPRPVLGAACAAIAGAAMVWAAWIATGHDLSFLEGAGWAAIIAAPAAAGVRTGWSRRAARTPAPPAPRSPSEDLPG